jgi:hypothetical protein
LDEFSHIELIFTLCSFFQITKVDKKIFELLYSTLGTSYVHTYEFRQKIGLPFGPIFPQTHLITLIGINSKVPVSKLSMSRKRFKQRVNNDDVSDKEKFGEDEAMMPGQRPFCSGAHSS